MKPLKKFSAILEQEDNTRLVESLTNSYGAGILDLVKKLGYSSMDEIAKEKKLLSKLESLLKDLPKKKDISEDDAEEIEANVLKRGEPRSLETMAGDKVTKDEGDIEEADIDFEDNDDEAEDPEVGAAGKAVPKEVGDGEKTADEIEADVLKKGEPIAEPESKGETKVSPDEEITDEVPAEGDDEEAGREVPIYKHEIGEDEEPQINDPAEDDNPEGYPPPAGLSDDVPSPEEVDKDEVKAARRIKAFEEFIEEDGDGSTSTIIKKVRYSDDATEPEDYGAPVAASADPMADVKEGFTYADAIDAAGRNASKEDKNLASFLKKLGATGVSDLKMIASYPDENFEEDEWKSKGKSNKSEIYDTVEIGTYDGKPAIVGNSDGDLFAFVKEGYDGEKRGEDDEHKGDEDEDKGDKKVDSEDDKEKADHYKGAVKSDDKELAALKKDKDYDEEKEKEAKANESHVFTFDQFINEAYDKVVWGGDKDDKSKTHDGVDYPEDEDEKKDEAYDKVVWGGDKDDKSKTHDGVDYPEDEDEKQEEKFDDVTLGGNKGDKSKSEPGEEDYEDDDKKEEKFDVVTLGGNKGDKSKSDPGEEDYEDDDKKEEDCGADHGNDEEEKDESVTEETDEMEAKAETIEDEDKAEETGAAGITIPLMKGDGSESAAGIAAGMMELGKPKKEPEAVGAGFVTKEQPVEEEPETSPDDVGTKDGGKVVTSVPDSNVSESFKATILRKFGKSEKEINESLQRIAEKEITSDEEFKEYAGEVLKQAHGDDFDQAKADEVINGLKDKYKGDYGAMIGALQSSMG